MFYAIIFFINFIFFLVNVTNFIDNNDNRTFQMLIAAIMLMQTLAMIWALEKLFEI